MKTMPLSPMERRTQVFMTVMTHRFDIGTFQTAS
jgi:hypothetical protein